jgi:hypothetical protein
VNEHQCPSIYGDQPECRCHCHRAGRRWCQWVWNNDEGYASTHVSTAEREVAQPPGKGRCCPPLQMVRCVLFLGHVAEGYSWHSDAEHLDWPDDLYQDDQEEDAIL